LPLGGGLPSPTHFMPLFQLPAHMNAAFRNMPPAIGHNGANPSGVMPPPPSHANFINSAPRGALGPAQANNGGNGTGNGNGTGTGGNKGQASDETMIMQPL
jgi:hypothetical protein